MIIYNKHIEAEAIKMLTSCKKILRKNRSAGSFLFSSRSSGLSTNQTKRENKLNDNVLWIP